MNDEKAQSWLHGSGHWLNNTHFEGEVQCHKPNFLIDYSIDLQFHAVIFVYLQLVYKAPSLHRRFP